MGKKELEWTPHIEFGALATRKRTEKRTIRQLLPKRDELAAVGCQNLKLFKNGELYEIYLVERVIEGQEKADQIDKNC